MVQFNFQGLIIDTGIGETKLRLEISIILLNLLKSYWFGILQNFFEQRINLVNMLYALLMNEKSNQTTQTKKDYIY